MPFTPTWEDNVFGLIPREEWLDVGFNVTRPNDPIDGLFGDVRTNNLVAYWQSIASEYQVPMMAQFHGFDTEAQTTFRVPVDTHNIEKGLIKVKINQSERMRELLRSGVTNSEMYDYIINDGVRLADQVVTRTKVAKNELMATGKVTINENNLNLEVDYGVSPEQTSETIDLSSGADAPAAIQKIIDAAADKGVTLTGLLTSRKNITKLRSNEAIQKAINGTSGVGALVRTNALYAYLEDEFGISRIITNDLTYGADATIGEDGRPTVTQKRYFPQNKLSFFAANSAGRLGDGLWGDPPEADIKDYFPVSTSNVSPFVYVMQWSEKDPAVIWTKASGLFIPMLFNPNSLWIATVSPLTGSDAAKVPSQRQTLSGMGSKTVQDLIGDNVTISWNGINGSVKGDVKHVTGYELFPEEEQDGNFFPIVLDSSYKGKEITVQRKGGTAKTQADTEWIVRLSDGKATEFDVSSGNTKIAHLDFSGANLASAPLMVSRKKKS